jgi:hypothetical protein
MSGLIFACSDIEQNKINAQIHVKIDRDRDRKRGEEDSEEERKRGTQRNSI